MGFAFWFPASLLISNPICSALSIFVVSLPAPACVFLLPFVWSVVFAHATLPPAVISTFPPHGRLAEECLRGGTCMNCSWGLCKGVTPRPPSSLSLIATCISNGELCLLNWVSVWFSALPVRVLFYSGLGSLRRHSPVHVTLKVDALSRFISVTQLAIEKFGKKTDITPSL